MTCWESLGPGIHVDYFDTYQPPLTSTSGLVYGSNNTTLCPRFNANLMQQSWVTVGYKRHASGINYALNLKKITT